MTRLPLFLLLGLLAACTEGPDQTAVLSPPPVTESPEAIQFAVTRHSQAACDATGTLQTSVSTFLDAPGADTLIAARSQWQQSHQTWSRLLLAYQLARMKPPQAQQDRDPIDAHPILPGYLDRVPGYPRSGIVYSDVPLTPSFLQQEHQSTDFFYATLGFHPLETLLWGGIDQRPEHRFQLFQRPGNLPEAQFDSRTRRIELLRMLAHGLNRDMAVVCVHSNRLALMHALSEVRSQPEVALASLTDALEVLVDTKLAEWERNPQGETRNGMPIWHSRFARTDFEIMALQVEDIHGLWLSTLLPDAAPDRETADRLADQARALTASLRTHHETPANISPETIGQTRALAQVLREGLEGLLPEQAASEEAGQ